MRLPKEHIKFFEELRALLVRHGVLYFNHEDGIVMRGACGRKVYEWAYYSSNDNKGIEVWSRKYEGEIPNKRQVARNKKA